MSSSKAMTHDTKFQMSDLLENAKHHHVEEEVDVPTSDLPNRDTVVVPGMTAALQKLHDAAAVEAAKKGNTEMCEMTPYLTAEHLAPAFLHPRKVEYKSAGERWLEDALFIFAHSRAFDYESAANRFYKFNVELKESEIQSLDEIPHDVAETISGSGLYYHPPNLDAEGRSVIYANIKDFSFSDGYTLRQMKRMNMWLFWQWAVRHCPAPQVKGICFVLSYTGFTWASMNNEYKKWTDKVMMEMLPIKLSAFILAYPPFLINAFWAMMKLVLKQKILDRIQWLGTDAAKVKAKYLMFSQRQATGLFLEKPASLDKYCKAQKLAIPTKAQQEASAAKFQETLATIPIEFGGTFDIGPKTVRAHVESTWKVSDEKIPEGCYRIVKSKEGDA